MNRVFYPAIFQEASEGGFWVTFPDFPECMTQGDDMSEAYQMAFDALGLTISDMKAAKATLPEPSRPHDIKLNSDESLAIIEFDMLAYNKKNNSKAVKKTLTIPEWLNEAAIASGVNFSQVLQEALMQKILH